jgi:DNA-directed RNA polymerase subunit beta'
MNKYKFTNNLINKKALKDILASIFTNYGSIQASNVADELKHIGFEYSTKSGISISIEDLRIPFVKNSILKKTNARINLVENDFLDGRISQVERFQKIISLWNITSEKLKDEVVSYFKSYDPLNSIYIMSFSGARGNLAQVRQLVGMRGLMSDPNGEILDLPIKQNFREGLTITDYLMSGYGARKGVVDTSLKTANSGYLTRRLIDVAQSIIIREYDCFSKRSIIFNTSQKGLGIPQKDYNRIIGRILNKDILISNTNEILIHKGVEITPNLISLIQFNKTNLIPIRSSLTCELNKAICQKCYGWDLANENIVKLGSAVGIIAGQSIGEPGTQLTMRTFHTGGVFSGRISQQILSAVEGILKFSKFLQAISFRTNKGENVIETKNSGTLLIFLASHKVVRINIPSETLIFIKDKTHINIGTLIAQLPETNKKIKIEIKPVLSNSAGEISLSNSGNLVWLLIGKLFNVEKNSYSNFNNRNKILKNTFISRTKLINKRAGLIKILENRSDVNFPIIQILNKSRTLATSEIKYFLNLENEYLNIFKIKDKYFLLDYLIPDNRDHFKIRSEKSFAEIFTNNYNTVTGGIPYFMNSTFEIGQKVLKQSGLLWLSEETYLIDRSSDDLLVKNGEFVLEAHEIVKNTFSNTSGVIEIFESNDIVSKIVIKSGYFSDSKSDKNFSPTIFYSGEILFNNLKSSQVALCEIIKTGRGLKKIIRPLTIYQLSKVKSFSRFVKSNCDSDNLFRFRLNKSPLFINKEKINNANGLQLFRQNLKLGRTDSVNGIESKTEILIKIIPQENFQFSLIENVYVNNYVSNQLKEFNFKVALIIQNNQIVNPFTVLGYLENNTNKNINIVKIKNRIESKNFLFIIRKEDCVTTPSDLTSNLNYQSKNTGRNIKNHLKILIKTKTKSILQKSYPYRLSSDDKLFCKTGDLIEVNQNLGFLSFEKEITADITQGLPKIDEIFEARKNINITELSLTKKAGLDLDYNFITLGTCLKNQKEIPLHTLLELYFLYFNTIENIYESTYRSIKKIEGISISLIQSIYQAEGVMIGDKHLEIIIRQMATKVKIFHKGEAPVFQNELVDLHQIKYINETLFNSGKQTAFYKPILLGITKASLTSRSFVSAASFQETMKVLTKAAVEGQTDWLTGLKENIVVGRLIPAGTSFNLN